MNSLYIMLFLLFISAANAKQVRVAWLSPMTDKNTDLSLFWPLAYKFIEAASEDLNIDLKIYFSGRDHLLMEKQAKNIANGKEGKFDMVMFYDMNKKGPKILKLLDSAGVNFFTFNTDFHNRFPSIGRPREKFSHWCGSIAPDDIHAGQLLAEVLIQEYKKKYPGQKTGIIGFQGISSNASNQNRKIGLEQVLAANFDFPFRQYVHGRYNRDVAKTACKIITNRYPDDKIYWAVNDGMALGIYDAIKEKGLTPGKDVIYGGIDWIEEAIELIKQQKMNVSVGGHFIEGAFVLVLIHDFVKGKDFAETSQVSFKTKMIALTKDNINQLDNWSEKTKLDNIKEKIDFKSFSRFYNPQIKKYNFSIQQIINEL